MWERRKKKEREGEAWRQFRFHSSHYSSDTGQCRGLSLPCGTCSPNYIQRGAALVQLHQNEIILYLSGRIDFRGVDGGPGTTGAPSWQDANKPHCHKGKATPVRPRSSGRDFLSHLYFAILSYSSIISKRENDWAQQRVTTNILTNKHVICHFLYGNLWTSPDAAVPAK